MPETTTTHLVSRAELRDRATAGGWDDPDDIAAITESKRAALLANPLSDGDDEPVRIIGTLGDRVIGRMDLLAGTIEVPGGTVRCFWGSGLYVAPEYRRTLMGVTLIVTMQRLREAAGACGVARAAYPVYRNLRYFDIAMPRYVVIRRTSPLLRRYLGVGLAAKIASRAADSGLLLQWAGLAVRSKLAARGLRCEQTPVFPARLEGNFRRQSTPVAMHRSAAWINWLLEHEFFDDGQHRRALHLVYDRDDAVVAYFLIKARLYEEPQTRWNLENLYLGSLSDWMIFDSSAVDLEDIVFMAVGALRQWEVDAVEVCVPPDVDDISLRRWGFVRAGDLHLLVWSSPQSALSRPEWRDPSLWRVRHADGDNFLS